MARMNFGRERTGSFKEDCCRNGLEDGLFGFRKSVRILKTSDF